jgi:hypothetical protein
MKIDWGGESGVQLIALCIKIFNDIFPPTPRFHGQFQWLFNCAPSKPTAAN